MKRRSKREWATLIEQFYQSSESQEVFCRRHGITRTALQYHLNKEEHSSSVFLPVQVREDKMLEIHTSSGTVIRIPL